MEIHFSSMEVYFFAGTFQAALAKIVVVLEKNCSSRLLIDMNPAVTVVFCGNVFVAIFSEKDRIFWIG